MKKTGAVFVPGSPNAVEGDGWLTTVAAHGETGASETLVSYATALARGPVARVAVPDRVLFTLHGDWLPASAGS